MGPPILRLTSGEVLQCYYIGIWLHNVDPLSIRSFKTVFVGWTHFESTHATLVHENFEIMGMLERGKRQKAKLRVVYIIK